MLRALAGSIAGPDFAGSRGIRLVLALALATLAGVLVFAAIGDREDTADAASVSAVPELPVIIARRSIPAGTEIRPEMVELVSVPEDSVVPGAVASSDLAVGQIARIPIYKGEQLLGSKLAALGVDTEGLSYTVPPGMRALAVKVDKVIGAGGLLRPGDRVDVLALVDAAPSDGGGSSLLARERRAVTIAQNVEVLAVEQEIVNVPAALRGSADGESADGTLVDQAEAQPAGTVATLAVTLSAAERIFLAEEEGALRLAVRALGDTALVESGLSGGEPAPIASPADPPAALSAVVPEGMRALAVAIDKVVGVGGLLRPGDRVDVVAVLSIEQMDYVGGPVFRMARAVTIAQNVEVLAVEQALLADTATGAEAAEQPLNQPQATAATLALTPQQAQQVLLAEAEGLIRLAVRTPGDTAIVELEDSTFLSVTDATFQTLIEEAYRTLGG